jgi:hypothetical protein
MKNSEKILIKCKNLWGGGGYNRKPSLMVLFLRFLEHIGVNLDLPSLKN